MGMLGAEVQRNRHRGQSLKDDLQILNVESGEAKNGDCRFELMVQKGKRAGANGRNDGRKDGTRRHLGRKDVRKDVRKEGRWKEGCLVN